LSFLGLGMRAPAVSWGVLLQDAQNVRTVALHPWLLIPGLCVIITILAFNFLGDGLRDAADPYPGFILYIYFTKSYWINFSLQPIDKGTKMKTFFIKEVDSLGGSVDIS